MELTINNIFFDDSNIAILHGVSGNDSTFNRNIYIGKTFSKLTKTLETNSMQGEKIIELIDRKFNDYQIFAENIEQNPLKMDNSNTPIYPLIRINLLEETGSSFKCEIDDDNDLQASILCKKMSEQAKEEIEYENQKCYNDLHEYFESRNVELIDFFRFEDAKILLEEALEYFPNEQNFKINLGLCQTELGEHSEAMETFNNILKADNNCYLAYINRGILYRKLEKYSKAINDLEKAIEIDEYDTQSIKELAFTYIEMGKPKTALQYAKNVMEIEPEEEYSYLILGLVYNAMGKNKKALKSFNYILNEMNPFDHWALLNRGKILFEEFNEDDKALNDLEFAQKLGNPYANEIIEEIYLGEF